ncbi:type II toxin-antitoxin system ParD family antitoxin [Roseomonas sp. KE2513]|uniref:type II toxin-antitoxin system ParD family antitoxin n=1 Tax=Roseomonas sp. KE2513 TaxID=2479202 RepID=UPI00281503A6|nr:type II toxin-antitoxin system ParD family antitoxin [Roseomonas sp. KE2513]
MTVSLTPELRRYIEAQVASGRYQTASEVVQAGLQPLTMLDPPHHPGHATADTTIFPKKA